MFFLLADFQVNKIPRGDFFNKKENKSIHSFYLVILHFRFFYFSRKGMNSNEISFN